MWRRLLWSTAAAWLGALVASPVVWAHGGGAEHSPLPWSFPEVFFAFGAYGAAALVGFLFGRLWYEAEVDPRQPVAVQAASEARLRRRLFRVIPGAREEGGKGA